MRKTIHTIIAVMLGVLACAACVQTLASTPELPTITSELSASTSAAPTQATLVVSPGLTTSPSTLPEPVTTTVPEPAPTPSTTPSTTRAPTPPVTRPPTAATKEPDEARLQRLAASIPYNWQRFGTVLHATCNSSFDGKCHFGVHYGHEVWVWEKVFLLGDVEIYATVAHELGHEVIENLAQHNPAWVSFVQRWANGDAAQANEYAADCLAAHWGAQHSHLHYWDCPPEAESTMASMV